MSGYTETEFLACLLMCGPPIPGEPFGGSNWPQVFHWYKDTYPSDKHMGAYEFYDRYRQWWKEQMPDTYLNRRSHSV